MKISSDVLNALIVQFVFGYSDPVIVYAWHDRKQKTNPRQAFQKAPSRLGHSPDFGTYVDAETGRRLPNAAEPLLYFPRDYAGTRWWELVNEMRRQGRWLSAEYNHPITVPFTTISEPEWRVVFRWGQSPGQPVAGEATDPDLLHATCMAALRAFGVPLEQHATPEETVVVTNKVSASGGDD